MLDATAVYYGLWKVMWSFAVYEAGNVFYAMHTDVLSMHDFKETFVPKVKKQPQMGIFSFFAKRAEHEWCDRELFMAGST